jgi:hypothetical protein
MATFTGGKRDAPWPYGVEWLGDAYPMPHWAREQLKGKGQQGAAAGGGGGGADGGGGGAQGGS